MRNEKVIEAPVDQNTVTKRYTEEVIKFITANKDKPFFVYLPHTMPHLPIFSSGDFAGKSANGKFGDAVQEIDWSTGRILETLKQLGIDKNTLVVFTSDNGAARGPGGSNGPLSGWKGSTMEGGMREPCVMRWPGKIPAGAACDELAITMDLLPTFAKLAGTNPPADRIIDVIDGRAQIASHGSREMPIWGQRYTAAAAEQFTGSPYDQEAAVRGRVLILVDYLRRIQQK